MFISMVHNNSQGCAKCEHKAQGHCLHSLRIGDLQERYVVESSVLLQEEC